MRPRTRISSWNQTSTGVSGASCARISATRSAKEFGLSVSDDTIYRAQIIAGMAAGILPAHGIAQRLRLARHLHGVEHLSLLGAHRASLEPRRRLHGHKRQELEQVIGRHVAQRAGLVVG